MKFQSRNNNYKFKYQFYYLLIYIIILFNNSESKNIKLSLINNESIIKITFANNGKNFFINNSSIIKPSSISPEPGSKCDLSKLTCDIKHDKKTIILNFGAQRITSCESMFKDLVNIKEVDLSNFDASEVINMNYMFSGCSNLEKITFGNMDTSKVETMNSLFNNCTKLESLDLTNFDTSLVKDMGRMFSNLHSLVSLKLSNKFNTSNIVNMYEMFSNLWNLTSIDLSMFITSKVSKMTSMFSGAKKLKSLDISNFVTSNYWSLNHMFIGCDELQYLNINKFDLSLISGIEHIFPFNNKYFKFCIKYDKQNNINPSIINRIICSDTCMIENNIYIDITKKICKETCGEDLYEYDIFCNKIGSQLNIISTNKIQEQISDKCEDEIDLCIKNTPECYYFDINDRDYKECYKNCKYCHGPGNKEINNCKECKAGFKFLDDIESTKNNCYQNCPFYYYFNKINNYVCANKCPDEYSKIILSKRKCTDECKDVYNIENNGFCINKCPTGTIYNETKKICEIINAEKEASNQNDIITKSLQESIKDGSFSNIINDVIEGGNDFTISNENALYQITSSDNQKINKYNNFSTIDFGECEKTLKGIYGIDSTIPLTIFKVEYYNNDSLIPIIGYEVYNPIDNSKLELSYCSNTINLNIPVQIDENKIYQYDPNSDYYVDQCSSYTSDNGTDILLYDRKKEYNDQNLSLCEANCYYQGYETATKQSKCECQMKNNLEYQSELSINHNALYQDFNISENELGYTNVFACTKTLFTVNGILKNMSSYILIVSLLFFTATSFLFKRRGYHIIVNHMNNIINEKMNYQSHKKNLKINNSLKLSKYKNDEKINFPPKKSDNKQANIISGKNSKIKISKSMRNKRKKESSKVKIVGDSAKKINESDNIKINSLPDCELNSFNYLKAISYDKRTLFQYYISLLKAKQPILFAFFPNNDYNSRLIKIGIFILFFNIHYATNFVYFMNEKIIHKIFEDSGKYDIIYFLPYIVITFIISHIITIIIKIIFLSDSNIIELKKQKQLKHAQEEISKVRRKLIIKYIIFFIIGILFHLFFWIALSSFSTMYTNTQVFVLENALLAFAITIYF